MLSNNQIAQLIARLKTRRLEFFKEMGLKGEYSKSVEEILDNEEWFIKELKRSGKHVAADHFSVDHIDVMAKCFDIDFQTFRHLDIGDAFVLEEEWIIAYASPEDMNELYPRDFSTQCEFEASMRKDAELIAKVGIVEFFKLREEERKRRRNVAQQYIQPPSLPIHLSFGRRRLIH